MMVCCSRSSARALGRGDAISAKTPGKATAGTASTMRSPRWPPDAGHAVAAQLFMNIPWTADGTLAWAEPVSAPGGYVVPRAEMDLVIAFSACPQEILPINGRTGQTTEAHFTIE
jgi:uncharacterized protein YcgI (DUF1989 family)